MIGPAHKGEFIRGMHKNSHHLFFSLTAGLPGYYSFVGALMQPLYDQSSDHFNSTCIPI